MIKLPDLEMVDRPWKGGGETDPRLPSRKERLQLLKLLSSVTVPVLRSRVKRDRTRSGSSLSGSVRACRRVTVTQADLVQSAPRLTNLLVPRRSDDVRGCKIEFVLISVLVL
jgi:hypothetical protein